MMPGHATATFLYDYVAGFIMSSTTGHDGLQDHYPIQEQGREERLYQLQSSVLSIVGKVSVPVILICLQKLAERINPESQCGFQA